MSASIKHPTALVFTLAISLFALPALGAAARDTGHKSAQHRVADFEAARAYVSPAPSVAKAHETDGLSRDGAECSRGGCVDN
jgi:hypothetical protein